MGEGLQDAWWRFEPVLQEWSAGRQVARGWAGVPKPVDKQGTF